MFDWDGNLLNLHTPSYLLHYVNNEWIEEKVTNEELQYLLPIIDNYYLNGGYTEWKYIDDEKYTAFSEFRDNGYRGNSSFLLDTMNAINKKQFGSIWNEFIDCIVGGYCFAIITARGHEPNTIRETIKWIINNYLSCEQYKLMIKNLKKFNSLFDENDPINFLSDDEIIEDYLNDCEFIGISSEWFGKKFNVDNKSFLNDEYYKLIAAKYFINRLNHYGEKLNKKVEVGFSDDTLKNVTTMFLYFKNELSKIYPNIKFNVYHSTVNGKIKITSV